MKWFSAEKLYGKINFISAAGIVFFLPVFGRLIPVMVMLMTLNWLVFGRPHAHLARLFSEPVRLKMISFITIYLLYLAGMFYSRNKDFGWFDLEIKLSLFIFPLIFAGSVTPLFSAARLNLLLKIFLAGCVTGGIVLLIHAWVSQFFHGNPGSFFYTRLAWYFHSTYLAMYYNLASAISFFFYLNVEKEKPGRGRIFLAMGTFFIIMIFLLSSKAGILALAVIFTVILLMTWFLHQKRRLAVYLSIYGLSMLITGMVLTPSTWARFSAVRQAVTTQSDTTRIAPESNADRLAVWHVALNLIGRNFWCGVGTGDVKDELVKGYSLAGAVPAKEKKYNAHSQYLQTFVALGFPGFLALLFMFLLPGRYACKNRNYLYLIFLMIIVINAMTESILEVQAGVIFYAFFNLLLFTAGKTEGPGFPEPV
jgi:O-antigen ligase